MLSFPSTFADLSQEWLDIKRATLREDWWREASGILAREILPALGAYRARRDLSRVLEAIPPCVARNAHTVLSRGVQVGRAERAAGGGPHAPANAGAGVGSREVLSE